MAGADIFTIRLTGKGGHGAAPHRTIDPVTAAAQFFPPCRRLFRAISPRWSLPW